MHWLFGFAKQEGDSTELTISKGIALGISLACCISGALWSLHYHLVFGAGIISILPIVFIALVGPGIIVAHLMRNHIILVYIQITCIMGVTHFIQWSIGSIDQSGLVLMWSFLGPPAAIIFLNRRNAIVTLAIWFILLVISTVFEPNLFGNNFDLPRTTKAFFYILNTGVPFIVLFLTFMFFHREKERGIELIIKNQELERTNYEQELLLRQSEKLATLGRLSAGVAHELNNPSAAVQRGAIRLQEILPQLNEVQYQFVKINFSPEEVSTGRDFIATYIQRANQDEELDALERSDLEYELEMLLEDLGIKEAWKLAPALVQIGMSKEVLKENTKKYGAEKMNILLGVINQVHTTKDLLEEIKQGTGRISEIIKALKAYTYMDQAPRQFVQINEGLDNTLVMLRSKLKHGIVIHKDYEDNLPEVFAYGSELNQVWTNLIDNAIDAMEGHGEIYFKTCSVHDKVLVEIKDTGKGMPQEVKKQIFDPFFTTKEQGKGTGLGLHISYNIIVNKHQGDISVSSKPGETIFKVELPINKELVDSTEDSITTKNTEQTNG